MKFHCTLISQNTLGRHQKAIFNFGNIIIVKYFKYEGLFVLP